MLSLVFVFAADAFHDGLFGIASAVLAHTNMNWGFLLLEGFVNIAVAAVAALWPGITIVAWMLPVAF